MASSMNSIDLYRDAALDDLPVQSERLRQNGMTQRRNGGQHRRSASTAQGVGFNSDDNRQPLSTPDGPLGPPISYRGIDPNADPRMHRSFSQRAKGRFLPDEAFVDDLSDDFPADNVQNGATRSPSMRNTIQSPLERNPPTRNGPQIQNSPAYNQRPRNDPNLSSQYRKRQESGDQAAVPTSAASGSKSATLRDAANQTEDQRRDWASDRSPLQKLEVKLTDISKEEKRARVQEAEMKLRDSQPIQNRQRPQNPVGNNNMPNTTPSTRVSSQQGPRSTEIPPMPTKQTVSSSRRVSTGKPQATLGEGFATASLPRQRDPFPPKQYVVAQRPANNQSSSPRDNVRSFSATQAPSAKTPADRGQDQMPRSVSFQQRRPPASTRNDRPISERERNASHQAALQQLTGQGSPRDSPRNSMQVPRKNRQQINSNMDKPLPTEQQASPIGVDLGTLGGEDHNFDQPPEKLLQQKRAFSASQALQQDQMKSPSDVQAAGDLHTEAQQSLPASEVNKSRQHRSSVSFKEPFERRRPVDEWRSADIARLTTDDFLTEEVKADDTYKPWWEQDSSRKASRARASSSYGGPTAQIDDTTAAFSPSLHLKCGPLLRYTGLKRDSPQAGSNTVTKEFWRGTVMIVTQDSQCSYDDIPTLRIFSQPRKLLPPPPALVTGDHLAPEYIDPIAGLTKLSRDGRAVYVRPVDHLDEAKDLSRIEDDTGIYEASPSLLDVPGDTNATAASNNKRTLDMDGERLGRYKEVKGVRIYADPDRDVTFWRFGIEIELGPQQQHIAYRINKSASVGFWVPARGQTMNMMFHSCNGFSASVDPDTFSGPDPLWRDVLNNHQTRPFHVMIGGGDQIYNDRVMMDTHLFAEWTHIRNPHHKHQAHFTPEMKEELESFYLERYAMWFSQGLFGMANASIPMVNMWDDHDIIDGFGSYPDDFMKSPVFSGLGGIAFKYYMLFQHQSIEAMTEKEEPSWILGHTPGPYITHMSRSVYLELGQSVAFLALDCRTERTRNDVLSIDTLELVLDRCRREMVEGRTKHLIVLLGVPIAYPRLVWLENVLTSKALDPVKALGRAGIIKTKFLNKFDGGVEILDDLDDHWTASHHKDERNILIQELQDLAAEKSARITILGGDVHLAAIGQFYSNPKLQIPKDRDHRYMPNIISSAIVNTPPPELLADVLNKRNKVHHLDKYTDENMIPMFSHDVDGKKRNNNHLLPRRNWCSIKEYFPGDTPPPSPSLSATVTEDRTSLHSNDEGDPESQKLQNPKRRLSLTKSDFNPRTLIRRLSSKGPPPNSYRASNDSNQFQQRAASFDGADHANARPTTFGRSPSLRASSADHVPDVPALRPSFHRRPTNLSEKAAKKGNVPALDADGNEIDVNDHVNLEGGLDIVLNCEINQKDPTGITTPYRLLVPALWYDGSSDREKLETTPAITRNKSLLDRLGFGTRAAPRPAASQGAGNWGQKMSDSESEEDNQDGQREPPKRRFSIFGSRRRKQPESQDFEADYPPANNVHQQEQSGSRQIQPSSIAPSAQPASARSVQPQFIQDQDAPTRNTQSQSAQRQHTVPTNASQSSSQSLPQPHRSYDQVQETTAYPKTSREVQTAQVRQQPRSASQQLPTASSSRRSSQRNSRPLSYTIGGAGGRPSIRSEYSSTEAEGRPAYDPDAAYVMRQQQQQQQQRPISNSQRSSGGFEANKSNRGSAVSSTSEDNPQQRVLRGNGIIGKTVPPSSYRGSSETTNNNHHNTLPANTRDQERGYDGIEAYKEGKPRRRWSLREKARNLMDNLESRRRTGEDWYSDEEEEEYWEGPRKPQLRP